MRYYLRVKSHTLAGVCTVSERSCVVCVRRRDTYVAGKQGGGGERVYGLHFYTRVYFGNIKISDNIWIIEKKLICLWRLKTY